MNESNNEIVMSNLFTFENLVQFPLNSIIESSAKGNATTLHFLNEYCFKIVNGKSVAKTFTFYYDYVKGGSAQTMKVDIPVMSLITIPYYTINSAHFEMGINIICWSDNITKPLSAGAGTGKKKDTKLLAMLGPCDTTTVKSTSQSTESMQYSKINTNMKVKMEVALSDLPSGIMQLINVSSQGVDGQVTYDLKISPSTSRLIMEEKEVSLSLKIERNKKEPIANSTTIDEIQLVPLTLTIQSNETTALAKTFSKNILVNKGDIVGSSSIERVQVLTDSNGEVEITFHPTLTQLTNGFITVSSPLTSTIKIYFRINNND
ncbi:DUF2589 domain-containing protein [Shewanella frigidimarina]|uniref:DUF2589 domain-containing protein n=1 Tax=Shewanella frigidimarina TaxID=56812 RepID=UPI003D799F18